MVPPAAVVLDCTVFNIKVIVVPVFCGELFAVGVILFSAMCSHRIAGVSAVPGHRQRIVVSLITDGERRVFGRVPQTGITLDLCITYST